jgi:hypothetical protein
VRTSSTLRAPSVRFALAGLLIVTACVFVLRTHAAATNAAVAAWGATFDLTLTLPLCYWFFVVRTGKASPLTIAPVFIGGTVLAAMLIPRAEQHFLHQLDLFLVPAAELLLVGTFARRALRLKREGASVAQALAEQGRFGAIVTSEVMMFYYALCCWRKKPEERGTTFHERNGWSSIVACIIVLIAAESIGMHFFLRMWKPAAAWIWTAFDLWAIAWLLGDYHALRLRRTFVDEGTLHLRFGMRWNATVLLANIEAVTAIREEREWKHRDVLRVAILDEPRWLITLREPIVAHGLAGMTKTVRALAVLPDDDAFVASLTS